jgi:hypothetical protein
MGLTRMDMSNTKLEERDSDSCVTYGERVQVVMLRTSRESSGLDEEREHELAYFVQTSVEQPISDVKVDIQRCKG